MRFALLSLLLLLPVSVQAQSSLEERVQALEERLALTEKLSSIGAHSDVLIARWEHGLRLESPDGTVMLNLGGRLNVDWAFMSEDDALERRFGNFDDGVQFRRARLYLSGTLYRRIIFKTAFNFNAGAAEYKDLFIGIKDLPYAGTFMTGHFKEPFGFEQLTSGKFLMFMERGLTDALVPGRNAGIAFSNTLADKSATWQAGFFRDTDNFGRSTPGGAYAFTGRMTVLTRYEDGGRRLGHFGTSFSIRNPQHDTASFAAAPEAGLAPDVIATGDVPAENVRLGGIEVAAVRGPLSVQSEAVLGRIIGANGAKDPLLWGHYVGAAYFLTGEHRTYNKELGVFSRVNPSRNFGADGGWGAWEVAARLSRLDFDDIDEGVRGGMLYDVTLGVNWYLRSNTRMTLNYVYANPRGPGQANMVLTRFQLDF
ncbi:MAG: porin [Elusimicrobiota bacterium]